MADEPGLQTAFRRAWPGVCRVIVRLGQAQYKILIVGIAYSPEYVYIMAPGGASLAPDPAGYGIIFMPQRFLAARVNLASGFNQVLGMVYNKNPVKTKQTI